MPVSLRIKLNRQEEKILAESRKAISFLYRTRNHAVPRQERERSPLLKLNAQNK
ncbi:hypothetical protein STA3757_14860 [Stanieria sp. NIES-3757]|nr:hypothetical protein STA3757_14860 [Stanieria sp. NIES-3757]